MLTPEQVYVRATRAELSAEILRLRMGRAAIIEECAQLYESLSWGLASREGIAAAIRALKDKE